MSKLIYTQELLKATIKRIEPQVQGKCGPVYLAVEDLLKEGRALLADDITDPTGHILKMEKLNSILSFFVQ